MLNIGIIGATGYTGIELIRLLLQHPQAKFCYLGSQSYGGKSLSEVYPHFASASDLICQPIDLKTIQEQCELVFLALPHGEAISIAPSLLEAGLKLIDLGADFRLKNAQDYTHWYKHTPANPELLTKAVYGLPEAGYRTQIREAHLTANPGCYATAAILSTLPAIQHQLINPHDCIFDGKSGLSGAGRSLSLSHHFCEMNESFRAYQIAGKHRHTPEIEQVLSKSLGENIIIQFTPHVVPMNRGLLMTAYFKLTKPLIEAEALAIYQAYYANEYFVRVQPNIEAVQTNMVRGTNFCYLTVSVDPRSQRLVVVCVIDNLGKGAAGQAVQNMNLMYGFPEDLGLRGLQSLYL